MAYIGYYPFDNGLVDESVAGNDLTAVGGSVTLERAPFLAADIRTYQALLTSGVYLDTGVQLLGGDKFSVTIWMQNDTGASGFIFNQHDGTDGIAVELLATGDVRIVVNTINTITTPLPTGRLHCVTLSYQDGNIDLYVNGRREIEDIAETAVFPAQTLRIGGAIEMTVTEVAIHDSAVDGVGGSILGSEPNNPLPNPPIQTGSEFTPISMSGLHLWLDPSDASTVTESLGTISNIADKSDSALTANDPNGGTLPLQTPAWQNGLDALYINGGSGMGLLWDSTGTELNDTRTVFMIYEWVDGGELNDHLFQDSDAFHGTSAPNVFGVSGARVGYDSTTRVDGVAGTGATLTRIQSPHIIMLEFQSPTNTFNGIGYASSVLQERAPHIRVGDILAFDRVLSLEEKEAIEGYLAHKWDTTASLPAAHPYKALAPAPNSDDFYDLVSYLVPFDEASGTSATDYSDVPLSSTFVGNAAMGSAYGGPNGRATALVLDGAGDYVTVPYDASFDFSTGDYTVELHAYFNVLNTEYGIITQEFVSSALPFVIGIGNTWATGNANGTSLAAGYYTGSSWQTINTSWTPSVGQWYHFALTVSGTTMRLFVDGVQLGGDFTMTTPRVASTRQLFVGKRWDNSGSEFHNGAIANVRLTKGLARYTSDFEPPILDYPTALPPSGDIEWGNVPLVVPMAVAPDELVIYQGDPSITITAGGAPTWSATYSINGNALSGASESVTSYVDLTATSPITFAGNFTVEFWTRLNNVRSCMVDIFSDSINGTRTLSIYSWDWVGGSLNATLIADGGAGWSNSSGTTVGTADMVHLAMVRSGGVITLYWDGVARGTTASGSTSAFVFQAIRLGQGFPGAARGLNGYIDGFRMSNLARYTADFVPPTVMWPLNAPVLGDFNRNDQYESQQMIGDLGRGVSPLTPGYAFKANHDPHYSFGWLNGQNKTLTDEYHLGIWTQTRSRQQNIKEPIGSLNMGRGIMMGSQVADRRRAGFLAGTVTDENSIPLARKVRVYDRRSGEMVGERWSDETGAYRFEGMALDLRYTIVAVDYQNAYNAVIADNAVPEAY